jgi:Abortive infection alpha
MTLEPAGVAAGLWWRATRWSVGASARTGARLARAAADPALAARVVEELAGDARRYARDVLGITELDQRVGQLAPPEDPHPHVSQDDDEPGGGASGADVPERAGLRARGAQLLRTSAQLEPDDRAHPAYAHILTELAPDEARILRLLVADGARPAVDVRAANLIGVGSELVSGGLNMIGAEAGCQRRARVPAYLNNLERLGLIWFSREPIDDPIAYQVLEAQPEVMEAMENAARAKTVQRSIQLTPFGRDFCDVCLPLDTAEMEALSEPPAR